MRYNEKELQALSRQPAEMAAELGMRGPKKGSVLKRRLVKLVVNFLFYFRTDEAEPVGALLLERCRVTREEPGTFSISFVEDPERKYHFECSSEEQCQEWMEALRRASYEFMRRSLIFYRNEIQKVTGKDPLEQFGISEEARFQLSGLQLPKSAGTTGTSPHTQPSHLDLQREVFGLETSKA
ncbi:pleckstrin homology domain-containing family J member 1 isoform X2 [Saimiri boliviensis]|uniref:pleckstrin homology domain-containing family J member 1 isoform X2 n=1 Tax=Saimiri boliviensis TaxID=27679 RepID=UPI003D787861